MKENNQQQTTLKQFKTHILLPFIFVITLAVAIMFISVKDFVTDLTPLIVYFYFGVSVAYSAIAILDLFVYKNKTKGLKIFVLTMIILNVIASGLYLTFYLIANGR